MTTTLQSVNNSMTMWEDNKKLEEIRKLFAPKLNEMEFQFFVGLGKASGLNPFTREIWAVKYQENAPAQVFIGRDGYRKAAQAHSDYDYHQVDSVYENDKFAVVDGHPKHEYTLTNRGKLVGAYCIAKRHKSSRPMYVFVDVGEYSTGRSVWKDKPATMIKKVAESQCLRACFQDLLGGTYGEEEMAERANTPPVEQGRSKSDHLMDKLKSAKGQTIDAEPVSNETGEVADPQTMKQIHELISQKGFNNGRLTKAMEHYGVESLGQLTKAQADDFIAQLNKLKDKE